MWFLWSCVAFAGVLYLLWMPLRTQAVERGAALGAAYTKNIAFLTVIWFLYPVVFLAGREIALRRTREVLDRVAGRPGHIFNCGHGLLPGTDPEVVREVVDFVHEYTS